MDRRTALILTLLSVLLCACPGLTLCSSGYYVLSGSIGANGLVATLAGISAVVSGVLMSIIPLVLVFVTWRLPDRPPRPVTPEELDEKLPPAI